MSNIIVQTVNTASAKLSTIPAFAGAPACADHEAGKTSVARIGITVVFAVVLSAFSFSQASAQFMEVKCPNEPGAKGESLQKKLDDKAVPGMTVEVSGICEELEAEIFNKPQQYFFIPGSL